MTRQLSEREQRIFTINEDVVQALSVAVYSLQQGRDEQGLRAVETSLASARELTSELLDAGEDPDR